MSIHAWCHSIAQNDRGIINITGLEESLREILQSYRVDKAMLLPSIYGDAIYIPSEIMWKQQWLYFCRINSIYARK